MHFKPLLMKEYVTKPFVFLWRPNGQNSGINTCKAHAWPTINRPLCILRILFFQGPPIILVLNLLWTKHYRPKQKTCMFGKCNNVFAWIWQVWLIFIEHTDLNVEWFYSQIFKTNATLFSKIHLFAVPQLDEMLISVFLLWAQELESTLYWLYSVQCQV